MDWLQTRGISPTNCRFIEPAAGGGAFVDPLQALSLSVQAYDIDPADTKIVEMDFLTDQLPPNLYSGSDFKLTIGNPPFGKNSSKAIRFFNRAAEFSDAIAFILPRTFRKDSTQQKLDHFFHLADIDRNLPPHSFSGRGRPFDVPACFQIWEKKEQARTLTPTPDVSHLIQFCTPEEADLSLRRVGGRSGQVLPGTDYSPSSTYFVKLVSRPQQVRRFLEGYDWSEVRNNTAGVRSVSKRELALALATKFGSAD